jgi:hypothetical protein
VLPKKGDFSTVYSTVGQNFAAKVRDSAQHTAKQNDELTSESNGMQSSETLRNSLVLNTNQLLYQLSYAGVPIRKLFSAG